MSGLFEILNEKKLKLAAVESITGGSFAAHITKIPGASKVFLGSLVTYDTNIKHKTLNINVDQGVINQATATAMATSGQKFFGSDVCIGFTGNAGPDPVENKPVGLTYLAILYKDKLFEFSFQSSKVTREAIIEDTVIFGIKKILDILES